MAVTLVVDIGSCSVGAAVVSADKGTAPKILWSIRLPVALTNESERGHSLSAITVALESVLSSASAVHKTVHKTHVIFSSPWYVSKTKVLKSDYDKPTLITRGVIDQLIKEAENKVAEESKTSGELVEHRIIRSRVNGYDTPNPYNKKAKSLEVTFFASMIPKDVLDTVHRVIEKHFHIRDNRTSSFSLAAFSAISGVMPLERDYTIIDIRGEVTDLSLVTDGALVKSVSFTQGKNALVQAVSAGSGQSAEAALSSLNMAFCNESDPAVRENVMKFAEGFKQSWLQSYTKAIQDMSVEAVALPPMIFLMADADVETFFENMINEIKTVGNLHLLKHLNLRSFIESSSVATDEFLALESVFATMV